MNYNTARLTNNHLDQKHIIATASGPMGRPFPRGFLPSCRRNFSALYSVILTTCPESVAGAPRLKFSHFHSSSRSDVDISTKSRFTARTLSPLQRFRGNSQANKPIKTVGSPTPIPTPMAILSPGLSVEDDVAVSEGIGEPGAANVSVIVSMMVGDFVPLEMVWL